MKPREVSVSVVESEGHLYVNATFEIDGKLDKEMAGECERVIEGARKRMQKAIKKTLENVEV
jgi:hypothetical protein